MFHDPLIPQAEKSYTCWFKVDNTKNEESDKGTVLMYVSYKERHLIFLGIHTKYFRIKWYNVGHLPQNNIRRGGEEQRAVERRWNLSGISWQMFEVK